MALTVRIKPRALRQIHRAAQWWSENRLAAPGAIECDVRDALDTLVEQPGIGSKVENARDTETRRFYIVRTKYFIYYRTRGAFLEVIALHLPSGRLDMLLRYGKGGHCRRHRHVASTVTPVLEGEQFLKEMSPDGTTKSVHRKKGDYALAPADAHPHDECGGDEGGTALLSMTATHRTGRYLAQASPRQLESRSRLARTLTPD